MPRRPRPPRQVPWRCVGLSVCAVRKYTGWTGRHRYESDQFSVNVRRPSAGPMQRAPREAGLSVGQRWPLCQAPLVTAICLRCAVAVLGTVTVSSPSRKLALICSGSTSCGSAKERLKVPLRRSRIT